MKRGKNESEHINTRCKGERYIWGDEWRMKRKCNELAQNHGLLLHTHAC